MTLFCRSLPIFCPLSLEFWSGVKTTTRKLLIFLYQSLTPAKSLFILSINSVLCCFFRGISAEALLAQLYTLDNHSALYILHSLTPLAQFEERKILDLLQQLLNSPDTGQHPHRLLSCCVSDRAGN